MDASSLAKAFEKASHGSGMFELWDAFITSFAAFFAAGSGNDCDWLIERASSSMSRITKDAADEIPKLYDPIIQAFEDKPFQDLLGDVYMRLNLGNKNTGQFFTPYNVAHAMADLSIDVNTITKQIDEHGYITVNEPAAGGGANIIGLAETLKSMGINYQQNMWFVAQELSELTALTCYVQCSILGMAGIVQIGNTLAMDFNHSLYTPMCVLDDHWHWRVVAKMLERI